MMSEVKKGGIIDPGPKDVEQERGGLPSWKPIVGDGGSII